MATWRSGTLLAAAVVLVAAGARCYKPKIQEGGLLCAEGGPRCPDGFQCAADGTCRSTPISCQAGQPHIAPICAGQPGDPCDPICQSGCPCGRCNLAGKGIACTPVGTKVAGDICNAASDDCGAGHICLNDCGGGVARCFRFCGVGTNINEDVCQGQSCDVPVDAVDGGATNLTVCEPPAKPCTNPVGDSGECGSAALGCYITSTGETACDCKGPGQAGDDCGPFNSCIVGYRCIQIGGAAKCFQTCARDNPACPSSQSCKSAPGSANFGYCDVP